MMKTFAPVALLVLLAIASAADAARPMQAAEQGMRKLKSSGSPQLHDMIYGGGEISMLSMFGGYKTIYRTNDTVTDMEGSLPMGTLTDQDGKPLMQNGEPVLSNNPDFTSIQTTENGNVFILGGFEAPSPAAFYITQVEQGDDGHLTPISMKPTNWSAWGGLWTPCAGSVLPWGTHGATHAGGEEYEPDAMCFAVSESKEEYLACDSQGRRAFDMIRYFGLDSSATWEQFQEVWNPYMYGHGWTAELTSNEGDVELKKWMTVGRISFELWSIMPDNKTAYLGDDGDSCAFYKVVFSEAKDLSESTIYGAKMIQLHDVNGGAFDVEWIELGTATHDEIWKMVSEDKIKFTDIFDYERAAMVETPVLMSGGIEMQTTPTCPPGYTMINKRYSNRLSGPECLLLKDGMQSAAAFLETRRMVAYMGGTTEFSKFEGITYSPDSKMMYSAMSNVRRGMEDYARSGSFSSAYDLGGPNHIRLPYNPCGCVYAWTLDENYSAVHAYAELCGQPTIEGHAENLGSCDIRGISEPDNVISMPGHGTIIIGEDQGARVTDVMWEYDLIDKTLTRIFSAPYGAETTSHNWYPDVNGFAYLAAAVQHPYGESDREKDQEQWSTGLGGWFGAWAFKASDFANGQALRFLPIPASEILGNEAMHTVVTSAAAYRKNTSAPIYDMA